MSGLVGGALGKYRLVAEIARGGMGIVYLALVQGPGGFNKLVVVKELKPELVGEPAFLRMFLDEARLAARLNHPNIVQTNEVGSEGNRYFMAMDYLDGRAFDRVRRRSYNQGAVLALGLQLRVLTEVLSGLDYAHRLTDYDGTPLDLVHRDVSPSNIFLTFDGQVKLLDFGIAKTTDSSHETRVGVLKGKLAYMAPEQARGERVDARADTYAVGVMLWEALTSRRLRNTQNDYELLRSLTSEMPLASSVNPNVPPMLDAICARALAMGREARYPSAAELRTDLEHAVHTLGLTTGARELGATVSAMFGDERAVTNGLIEASVARARSSPERMELPVIHAAAQTGQGVTPSGEAQWPAWDAGSSPVPPLPTQRSGKVLMSPSAPGASSSAGSSATSLAGEGSGLLAVTSPGAPASTRGRRVLVISLATVAALAVVALAYLAVGSPGSSGRGAQAALGSSTPAVAQQRTVESLAGAPPTPAPAPAAVPATEEWDLVEIEVRVSPPEATVTIDGALVSGNPFRGKFARSESMREIRAEAPGFVPKSRALAFSANVKLDLSLERRPTRVAPPIRPTRSAARPEAPARAVDPTPTPAVNQDINPAGGSKPRRPIDSSNPYGAEP